MLCGFEVDSKISNSHKEKHYNYNKSKKMLSSKALISETARTITKIRKSLEIANPYKKNWIKVKIETLIIPCGMQLFLDQFDSLFRWSYHRLLWGELVGCLLRTLLSMFRSGLRIIQGCCQDFFRQSENSRKNWKIINKKNSFYRTAWSNDRRYSPKSAKNL